MVERKPLLANPKHHTVYPNVKNMIVVPINKRNRDYYEYPSLCHFRDELQLQGNWWKEKLFLQNQSINILYPNEEDMIVVHITEGMSLL